MNINQSFILISIFVLFFLSGFFVFNNTIYAGDNSVNIIVGVSICGNNIKEGGEQCDGADFGGKGCTGLDFSGGGIGCSASCEFDTTNCTSNAEATADAVFNSSTGGNYNLVNEDNSAEIDLPENFYTEDLTLEMFSYADDYLSPSKPAPAGESFVGKTYDFVFVDPNGDKIAALSKNATLILTYTDADLTGLDESTLKPYRWGSNDSSWQLIPGATVDISNNSVTFSTSNFSSFALFGSVLPACGDNSCNGSETCSTCPADCGTCPNSGTPTGGGGGSYIPPIPQETRQKILKTADFNSDGQVNMADLSILLFYNGRSYVAALKYDLNKNEVVDFPDVSILIYYWTITSQ